jgi:hypothetical protein
MELLGQQKRSQPRSSAPDGLRFPASGNKKLGAEMTRSGGLGPKASVGLGTGMVGRKGEESSSSSLRPGMREARSSYSGIGGLTKDSGDRSSAGSTRGASSGGLGANSSSNSAGRGGGRSSGLAGTGRGSSTSPLPSLPRSGPGPGSIKSGTGQGLAAAGRGAGAGGRGPLLPTSASKPPNVQATTARRK